MKENNSLTEIGKVLQKATKIVVVSHYNPDADAYGSSLGIYHSLKHLGKDVSILNESGQLDRYTVIPGLKEIHQTPVQGDVLLICDCAAYSRIGDNLKGTIGSFPTVINIDHHISNESFGTVNFVSVEASSTSEIILDLITENNFPINADIAQCLLAGIIGDTGSFRYTCTTQKTFRTAEFLMSQGASPAYIAKQLFGNTPLSAVRLQSQALLDMTLLCNGTYAEVVITEEMITRFGATLEDTDGLVEKVRDCQGVRIAASLRADGPIWRVSLRSTGPEYNVSQIAAVFGGGGHTEAAAFRSSKDLATIQNLLRQKVAEVLS